MTDETFLPPGTPLALGSGAQIVDAPAQRVGSWLVYHAVIGGKQARVREYFPERLVTRARDGTVVPTIEGPEAATAWDTGCARATDLAGKLRALDAHPGIAGVLDSARPSGGTVFFATSRQEGEVSLAARIATDGRLAPDAVMRLAAQVADALAVVHDRDILHLDLRPETVLVRGDQAVLDGFAVDERLYMPLLGDKATLVHPPYSAVELYDNRARESLTPSTDIHAASALLYTAMTGSPPPDWRERLANSEISARPAVKGYAAGFLDAIARGMTLEPSEAFVTVEAWREALFAEAVAPPRRAIPLAWWIVAAVAALLVLGAALVGSGVIRIFADKGGDGPYVRPTDAATSLPQDNASDAVPVPSPTVSPTAETSGAPTPTPTPAPAPPESTVATPEPVVVPSPVATPEVKPTSRPVPKYSDTVRPIRIRRPEPKITPRPTPTPKTRPTAGLVHGCTPGSAMQGC